MAFDDTNTGPLNQWWSQKRSVHDEVWSVVKRIEADQSNRFSRLKKYEDLYKDHWGGESVEGRHVVTFNAIRSIIDTACAKISKQKPRLQITTDGGDYGLRRRADLLTQYLDGCIEDMDLHRKAQLVFRDACIFDGGALRIYRDPGSDRVRCERVYPNEILVDSLEAYYGEPRQMFLKRAAHREVLAALYPKRAARVRDASPSRLDGMVGVRDSGSLVDVVESWHLPSRDGADDGRHVICIEGVTLFDEPWTRSEFPFVFFRWQEPVRGFWMPGLAQELWGLQAELNTHLENIREAHKLSGHPAVFVPNGANIDDGADVSSLIGAIIRGDQPPQPLQFPVMHPQVYSWTETLRGFGYEMTGASQASAEAKKPRGDLSGVAMRQVEDIETERWVLAGQRYGRFFREVGDRILRESRDAFSDGIDMTIRARDKDFLRKIKWSEVDMDDDTFMLTIFDTSNLPQRPESKVQTAMDLTQAGMVQPEVALEMIAGVPDIKSAFAHERAPRENILRMLDKMLEDGKQLSPLPYMDLELAQKLTINKLNWCDVEGVPEERKQLLLNFLAMVTDLASAAAPPAPPPMPMPMGGAPLGGGEPPMPMPMPPGGPALPPDAMPPMTG